MFCQKCGKEAGGSPAFCSSCGARLTTARVANRTQGSKVAGILDILSGVLMLLIVGVVSIFHAIMGAMDEPFYVALPLTVLALLSILAIAGGINALRRKNWGLALAGAMGATVTNFLLGIPALVLTVVSRDEFE